MTRRDAAAADFPRVPLGSIPAVTAEQMREVDRAAVESIPLAVYTELGLRVGSVFAPGPILRLE